jgi:hypothetical protein
MKIPEFRPCPFCASNDVQLHSYVKETNTNDYRGCDTEFVVCNNCRCHGPESDTKIKRDKNQKLTKTNINKVQYDAIWKWNLCYRT